ncbi:MAG: glycerol-3-phosphate acyltransferase, partial [Mycoplasmataceae bacterium]|nr:glycerol-3-phosphate acyltransferase [Mycoplasmataceae bacterium]
MDVLYNFIWILLSYLIGSVNFSIIFTKYNLNKDIRKVGSGNA